MPASPRAPGAPDRASEAAGGTVPGGSGTDPGKPNTDDPDGAPPREPTQDEQDAKKPRAKKPTLEQIAQWVRRDREHWNKRDRRMQRHHKLWRLDKTQSDRTEGLIVVTTNDPKVFIEKAAAMAVAKDHRIEVAPKGEQQLEAAERIENACRWKRSFERRRWREGLHNYLDYDQAQCLFLRGWLTARVMLDPDSRTFVDETMFDPLTVYPRVAGNRISRVCHVYKTTVDDLREDFGELPPSFDARDDADSVEVQSVYVNSPPYFHCVVVAGEFVKEPTALDYWPWVLATAKGAFSHHVTDFEPADVAAEHVGQGFLDAMEDAYRDLQDLFTIGMNLLAKQENPPIITTDPNGKPLEIDTGIGGRTPLAPGQDAKPIEIGARLQNVESMLTAFQDRENKAGFPAVAWGEGAGIQSGYQASLLMASIDAALVAYIRCLEGFHSARYEKWLELYRDHGLADGIEIVARVGATVGGKPSPRALRGKRAWGTVLLPEDIEANGTDVDVVYEQISPQDRMSLTSMAVQLVAAGIIDLRTARETYVGLDDADVINERVLADLVYKDQSVVQLLSELALRRTGRWNELQALRVSQTGAAGAPGPGGPGAPGGPPGQGALGPGGAPPPGSGAMPPGPPPGAPVHESINFKDLPPALQAQMAAQAGLSMASGGPGPGEVPPGMPPPGMPPGPGGPPPGMPPGAGPPPGGPPPEIPPEAMAIFQQLPPQLQALIARMPIAQALELLAMPPAQMLQRMAALSGGGMPPARTAGPGAGPRVQPGPVAPGPSPQAGLPPMQRPPPSPMELQAQRMARVGLVPARR